MLRQGIEGFPSYPAPLAALMNAPESNLHSMVLRPAVQDPYLRLTARTPDFSLPHDTMVRGERVTRPSHFHNRLHRGFANLTLHPRSKADALIERVLEQTQEHSSLSLSELQALLMKEAGALSETIDVTRTEAKSHSPSVEVTQAYLDAQQGPDASIEETLHYLLHNCAEFLFTQADDTNVSPFYRINTQGKLSMLTQVFLAETCIACRIWGLSDKDFGQILEQHPDFGQVLTEKIREALQHKNSIEDVLLTWMHQNATVFGLKKSLTPEQCDLIKQRVARHYGHIQTSEHYDEFLLMDAQNPGPFNTHQSAVVLPFVDFMKQTRVPCNEEEQRFIQTRQDDFKAVPKPQNKLPHKNECVGEQLKIEVDLKSLKPQEIEALYEASPKEVQAEILNAFPELLERKVLKQFLQHVAYGQQDEAEELLKNNPQLAHKLLTTHDIPFTDYSGRTFTCTAYEYAYWACDSHMRWMLEDYIMKDEATRAFIHQQVQCMEELVPDTRPSITSFSWAAKRPRGLDYTQDGTPTNSLHFDFKPLINALNDYVRRFSYRTEQQLETAWVKNVGMNQRDVPAHLAQEYCHPDRNFEQVSQNKDLLNTRPFKRQMKFYNFDTQANDSWFPLHLGSGLGFSIGILRDVRQPRTRRGGAAAGVASSLVDYAAVKAIEEVRLVELKQSFELLSRPLNAPSPIPGPS